MKLASNEILVLRTSGPNGESRNGFTWPKAGLVEAPDWNNRAVCGGGLHGLPRGCGDGLNLCWDPSASAQLVRVVASEDYVEFAGKCKFARGEVVYFGTLQGAIDILCQVYPDAPIVGRTVTVGDYGTATVGAYGTATAGIYGTATAGDHGTATAGICGTATAGAYGTATVGAYGTATAGIYGTATAGDHGTATAGICGTATAGDHGTATAGAYDTATVGAYGTATAGDHGTATAGDHGTATVGAYGTATAGDHGTATAGDHGTATAGAYGTATVGAYGTATAGDHGTIIINYWDGFRLRSAVGYIGEDGLEPNVPYRLTRMATFAGKAARNE